MKIKAKWKSILLGLSLILILASTVRFEKLDEVRARAEEGQFDPEAFAQDFWNNDLQSSMNDAVNLIDLMQFLKQAPEKAFEQYSKSQGIGNIRYFFIEGQGEIMRIGADELTVVLDHDNRNDEVTIATEYIFGNAVREATGKIKIQDFDNTMDYNNVSAAINAIIRKEILPPLIQKAEPGARIQFVGAMEMNREQLNLEKVEIIPVSVDYITKPEKTSN